MGLSGSSGPPSTDPAAVAALRAGLPVVLPTDTVYGLVGRADDAGPTRRIQELKGRAAAQPMALMAATVEQLLAALPELDADDGAAAAVRALLPGPYTLVLPNPGQRYPWLNGTTPGAVGVRVPDLPQAAHAVLAEVGVVASTSANLHGGPSPRSLVEVPAEIVAGCGAVLDGGALPGTPSTVVDLTGPEPRILREGAVPAAVALAQVSAARRGATAAPRRRPPRSPRATG